MTAILSSSENVYWKCKVNPRYDSIIIIEGEGWDADNYFILDNPYYCNIISDEEARAKIDCQLVTHRLLTSIQDTPKKISLNKNSHI